MQRKKTSDFFLTCRRFFCDLTISTYTAQVSGLAELHFSYQLKIYRFFQLAKLAERAYDLVCSSPSDVLILLLFPMCLEFDQQLNVAL